MLIVSFIYRAAYRFVLTRGCKDPRKQLLRHGKYRIIFYAFIPRES